MPTIFVFGASLSSYQRNSLREPDGLPSTVINLLSRYRTAFLTIPHWEVTDKLPKNALHKTNNEAYLRFLSFILAGTLPAVHCNSRAKGAFHFV